MDITSDKKINNDIIFNFSDSKNVDELYEQAVSIVIKQQKVSTSFVQRYLQIGYNRAARIIEKMEEDNIISEPSNAGKRSVLKKNV
jgi:S-DNA-T family DNA segregation ATPase FtsK/SpoIIIE